MEKYNNIIQETISNILSEESAKEYRRKVAMETSHGPLMKANGWIKPQKISDLSDNLTKEDNKEHFLYVGHLQHPFDENKKQHIAIFVSNNRPSDPEKELRSGFRGETVGYNKEHQWYEDSGLGYRFPSSSLVITGDYHKKADGSVQTSGTFDPKVKRTLMVYK